MTAMTAIDRETKLEIAKEIMALVNKIKKTPKLRHDAIRSYCVRYKYWEKTVIVKKHLREKAYIEYAWELY